MNVHLRTLHRVVFVDTIISISVHGEQKIIFRNKQNFKLFN